jgi:hypothetical protein
MLGDIDDDGCAEMAIGAELEDLAQNNQGTVRILFGWNASNLPNSPCPSEPRMLVLHSGSTNARAGYSVDGGHDVDGDNVPDLVVGAPYKVTDGNSVGAAWLVPGAYLKTLTPGPVDDSVPVSVSYPLVDPAGTASLRVDGRAAGELFGTSVALVPQLHADGRAGILVGGPLGDAPGVEQAGGARVYRYLDAPTALMGVGFDPIPVAIIGGETLRPRGRLGEYVSAGLIGSQPTIVMGGYDANALGLDEGAAYLLRFSPLPGEGL